MAKSKWEYQSPLKFIYDAKCGKLSDLEKKLGQGTVRQLEAMGFIKNAPSSHGETWKISSRAMSLAEVSFRPYSRRDRLRDFYRFKLPRMLFGV